MKVIVILIALFVLWVGMIWFIDKMNDWTESTNKTKSNIGCGVLSLIFIVFTFVAIIGSMKSCMHDAANSSPRYDYYDDRTPR